MEVCQGRNYTIQMPKIGNVHDTINKHYIHVVLYYESLSKKGYPTIASHAKLHSVHDSINNIIHM